MSRLSTLFATGCKKLIYWRYGHRQYNILMEGCITQLVILINSKIMEIQIWSFFYKVASDQAEATLQTL